MVVVSLDSVLEQIEMCSGDGDRAWLNRKTGELFGVSQLISEEIEFADGGDELPEWEREDAAKLEEIEGSDDWILLPDRFEIDEYRMMERFVLTQTADPIQSDLLRSISGKGAFRYFKDTIRRHGIQDDWFRFRNEQLKELAAAWLKREGIEFR